jgi:hypothetical protein
MLMYVVLGGAPFDADQNRGGRETKNFFGGQKGKEGE